MRYAVLVLCLLLLAESVFAQSTTVSGTITDQGAQAWFNGSYSFLFQVSPTNPTAQYFWNGAPFNINQTISGSLNSSASFSTSVPSNTSITPSGSSWKVTVCPAATATNGCYSIALTITGATQSITPQVIPPAVVVNLMNPIAGPSAYTDSEIAGAKVGSVYWNLTDSTQHGCGFPACNWISVGGASSVLPLNNVWTGTNLFTAATNINAGGSIGGVFSGNPTMTGNWTFTSNISGSVTNLVGPGTVTGNYTHSGTESFNVLSSTQINQVGSNEFAGVSACSGSTKAITFAISFSVPPSVVVFDYTTKGGANLSAGPTASGFTVSCTGATDAFSWHAIGNPN